MKPIFTFFDTSVLISYTGKDDGRISTLSLANQDLNITETIEKEFDEKIKTGFKSILNKHLKVISFERLRSKYPDACPLYYNYLSAMHNPALLHMEEFLSEMSLHNEKKTGEISNDDKLIRNIRSNRLAQDIIQANKEGNHILQKLSENELNNFRKKRTAYSKDTPNYFNDLRNLALIFLYALKENRNVRIITADSDLPVNMLTWASAMIHELVFKSIILKNLSTSDQKRILNGEKVSLQLNRTEFYNDQIKGLTDIYSNHTNALKITVDCWDTINKRYDTYSLDINNHFCELLLNNHGQHICHFNSNNTHGSYIGWTWVPPLSGADKDIIKTEVYSKGISNTNFKVTEKVHRKTCRYIKEDHKNNMEFFSQFL